MAAYSLYPEELDNFHLNTFKIIRNKSLFSNSNILKHSDILNEGGKFLSANRVSKAFRPLRIILTLVGRWPFQPVVKNPSTKINNLTDQNHERNNIKIKALRIENATTTYSYTSSLRSFFWLYFMGTTIFLSVVLFLSVLGFCDFFLEWDLFAESAWDEEERVNFESNLVPFVLVWSCLLHSSFSSISMLFNRKKVAKFLNYWNYAVEALDIEIPKEIRRYTLINHLVYLGFIIIIFIAYRVWYLNIVRGGATLIGILTFRPFITSLDMNRDLDSVRLFGLCTMMYAVYASRAFLFLFSFKTKLLRHVFKIWNARLRSLLESSPSTGGYPDEQYKCEKIFDDYRIMLKLVRLTDQVFGGVLQSYYGSQLINMCFELYYLARSGTFSETTMNTIGGTIVLFQNLFIFFTVSLDAAYVNEEATRGFEVLRSCGISPEDSIPRKYLISNMQMIFSQKIVLTGGKFFSVDRPFIVTVLGAVFTYFIIILQVGPSLHKKFEGS